MKQLKASPLETRFLLFASYYFFVISCSSFMWQKMGLLSAVAFTGGSLENGYCVKPAESSSAISVLVAIVYEVGQRGLKINPTCLIFSCFIVRGLGKRVTIATEAINCAARWSP